MDLLGLFCFLYGTSMVLGDLEELSVFTTPDTRCKAFAEGVYGIQEARGDVLCGASMRRSGFCLGWLKSGSR